MRAFKYFLFLVIGLVLCFSRNVTLLYGQSKVPREDFQGKVNAIALVPLALPGDLSEKAAAGQTFEDLITARLKEAGFSVVGSKTYDGIRRKEAEASGGYFDPISGKPDMTKLRNILTRTRQELVWKFRIDAILYPQIKTVNATFAHDSAHWHGTSEYLGRTESRSWKLRGTVVALSLFVRVEDNRGREIYARAGGIQVLAKAGFKGVFVSVPDDEILSNDKRNEWAVDRALTTFIQRFAPKP